MTLSGSIFFLTALTIALPRVGYGNPQSDDSQLSNATGVIIEGNRNDPPGSEMTAAGRDVRGIYVPVGKVRTLTPEAFISYVKQSGATGVVIDIKDDWGRVTFTSDLAHAQGSPHGFIPHFSELVERLKQEGIYTIARLVCFKDPLLARHNKDTAVIDGRTFKRWEDNLGIRWVDPGSQIARDHIVSIAVAAQALGVDEIQLDYVRFPVDPGTRWAIFRHVDKEDSRSEIIARLLKMVDDAVSIPLSIDVFGLTANNIGSSEPLGQRLEVLAPYIDAISPMVYLANWPRQHYENPSLAKTHNLVETAIANIRDRLGPRIVVRPLLQGFRWRAQNWGYWFLANQINAAQSGGAEGYLFWNAGGHYRLLSSVWSDMDAQSLSDDKTAFVVTGDEPIE